MPSSSATVSPSPAASDALAIAWRELLELLFNLHEPLDKDVLKDLRWITRDGYDVLCHNENDEPKAAVLSIIGRIHDSVNTCKFTPDGGWDGTRGSHGNLAFEAKFEKLALTAQLVAPFSNDRVDGVPLDTKWPTAIAGINTLIASAKGTGALQGIFSDDTGKDGVKRSTTAQERMLKISHKLFKNTETADNDINPNAVDPSWDASLTRTGWPMKENSAAAAALQGLDDKFKLVPLPAYTINASGEKEVILPAQYGMLRGALVQVDFMLTHLNISGSSTRNHFTAEIMCIKFLKPRFAMLSSSPKKKRRLNTGEAQPAVDN